MIQQVVHGRYDGLTGAGRYFVVVCVEGEEEHGGTEEVVGNEGEGEGDGAEAEVVGSGRNHEGHGGDYGEVGKHSSQTVHILQRRNKPGPTDAREMIVGAGGWSADVPRYDVSREQGAERVNGGRDLSRKMNSASDTASTSASAPAQTSTAKQLAWIRGIYVHPRYTMRGLGKMIVAHCEQEARKAGYERFELASTVNAVPVYERCGYKAWETRTIEMGTASGIEMDMVMMRKGGNG